MRFLCLHGMGTNAAILEAQFNTLVAELKDDGHEFVFVDGHIECETSQGPYLCYYNLPTPELVEAAHIFVNATIDEEGPFDGVIAFSQGAALAASIMLQHSKDEPLTDIFQLAIFAGASLPFDIDNDSGVEAWLAARQRTQETNRPDPEFSAAELDASNALGFPVSPGQDAKLLARYTPGRTADARIKVPTLHLLGAKDEYRSQAELLAAMCDSPVVLRHAEGHCVPRDAKFQRKMAAEVRKLVQRAQFSRT